MNNNKQSDSLDSTKSNDGKNPLDYIQQITDYYENPANDEEALKVYIPDDETQPNENTKPPPASFGQENKSTFYSIVCCCFPRSSKITPNQSSS